MTHPAGVTIAIANGNREWLLPRSIASALQAVAVLRRREMAGEVLVLDDHSRDGSLALLRNLEARHYGDGLRVLAFADHGALGAARNQGLLNARFSYIAFLDTGNELLAENLPLFVRTLQETRAAAAYGNLLVRTASSRCAHSIISNESMQAKLFTENYVDACAVYDRGQLLDVGGYASDEHIAADHEQWMHLAASGRRVVFVPVTLGYCYLLPGSTNSADEELKPVRQEPVNRMFDPLRLRARLPMNTYHLRYHPEIGYL
jgi:glycosyltransferase involved in cell wall biosynthesis